MYILEHYDWFGPIEELEKWEKIYKKHFDGSHGVEYLGRFGPVNKKYHWTNFWKAKDWNAWVNRKYPDIPYKRDYKVNTHSELEFYSDL